MSNAESLELYSQMQNILRELLSSEQLTEEEKREILNVALEMAVSKE